MTKRLLLFCLFVCLQTPFFAQSFTAKQYGWYVEKDLVYGSAVNYIGETDVLKLDLYKPIGDQNTKRPLLVLVHGGSWISGCKEGLAPLAIDMVQRGYAVACIDYRKGWHKDDILANTLNNPDVACLYTADSSEIYRAIYRGMQDTKGAIRFLKARAVQDSTCSKSVLVGGDSAGGFISMAVGYLDRDVEKPLSCGALPAVAPPGANMINCVQYHCVTENLTVNTAALQRPDLGSIEGSMNLNGESSSVIGVMSLYAGVPYEALAKNWVEGPNKPAVFMYHQTCDGVVLFGQGQPMAFLSGSCNLGATPWHTNYPILFGNGAVAAYFETLPNPPLFSKHFDYCDPFNPALALFDCIRFAQNGSYHYLANPLLQMQNAADFFNPVVIAGMTGPGGCIVSTNEVLADWGATVGPNPFSESLTLRVANPPAATVQISLFDAMGSKVWGESRVLEQGDNVLSGLGTLPKGMYVMQILSKEGAVRWKMAKV